MRVYSVSCNVNQYQGLYFKRRAMVDKALDDPAYQFNGTPVSRIWKPPEAFVLFPRLKVPNFWDFEYHSCLGVDEVVRSKIQPLLEMSGELLPIKFPAKPIWLLNVTQVVNCLDDKKSKGHRGKSGRFLNIEEAVFVKDYICEVPLFRVPQTWHIFAPEWDQDPDHEFKAAVQRNKLKGLTFTKVWESPKRSRLCLKTAT